MITDAEDGDFIRAYTTNGFEWEVRRVKGSEKTRYFAVFPNEEVTIVSEGAASPDEAAYVGSRIADLLS